MSSPLVAYHPEAGFFPHKGGRPSASPPRDDTGGTTGTVHPSGGRCPGSRDAKHERNIRAGTVWASVSYSGTVTAISDALDLLRVERNGLRGRLEQLDRAIKALEGLEAPVPERQEPAVTPRPSRSSGRPEGTPGAIKRVFAGHPARSFTVAEMHSALEASGWSSEAENARNVVSVNLRRMATRGQVERTEDGRFRVPYATLSADGRRVLEDQIADDVEGEEDWDARRDEEAEQHYATGD